MKFCPKCGTLRKEGKAFCADCGNAFAGDQAVSSTSAPLKNKLVLPLLALIAVALVGAGTWFFFAGGPLTMEEYRDETTQLWEEYFDNAIAITERIVRKAETTGWIGGSFSTPVVKEDVEYVLSAFEDYLDSQERVLRNIRNVEAPENMSTRDYEILSEFVDILIAQVGNSRDYIEALRSDGLPRVGSEFLWWDFMRELAQAHLTSSYFFEDYLYEGIGGFSELQEDIRRIAQEFNWMRVLNLATHNHLIERYICEWTLSGSCFTELALLTIMPSAAVFHYW